MKQLKKTLLTLVALLAVTTGAWATDYNPLTNGLVLHVGDTFTPDKTYNLPSYNWSFGTGVAPYKLVRVNATPPEFLGGNPVIEEAADGKYYAFYVNGWGSYNLSYTPENEIIGLGEFVFEATATSDGLTVTLNGDFVTFAVHEGPAVTFTPVEGKTNEWTMDGGMPAGNVTVSVDYYPQATVADGGVTAVTGAAAATDTPLVTVDKTKLTGGTELMFCVTETNTAPAYTAEGWTTSVPNAKDYSGDAEKDYYVWYYLKGADGDTDDATFSDGDMNTAGLKVTLAPEPTYNVEFAEGTNPEAPADPIWTASPNTGVKKGTAVTVTYTGTRKVIGVKAEKKKGYEHSLTIAVDPSTNDPRASAPAMTIEFNTGETWADVAARYDWLKTYMTYTVYYDADGKDGNVHDTNGGVTPDKTIDPNGSYHWGL